MHTARQRITLPRIINDHAQPADLITGVFVAVGAVGFEAQGGAARDGKVSSSARSKAIQGKMRPLVWKSPLYAWSFASIKLKCIKTIWPDRFKVFIRCFICNYQKLHKNKSKAVVRVRSTAKLAVWLNISYFPEKHGHLNFTYISI